MTPPDKPEINCPLYHEHRAFLDRYAGRELLTREEVEVVIQKTVKETLYSIGIDAADPIEMQRDFQTLRDWRRASTSVRAKGTMTIIAIITAGIMGALWIGVKNVLGKP